ncbi:MAG: fumarate reductase subunit FrdD [Burkholderiales bacterium]
MALPLKRSNAPIFWLLFGAGGMLAALIGPMLVFITGIGPQLGWVLPADILSYPQVLAFAKSATGKLFLFTVVTLFTWHAAHRIYHTLHDLGIRASAISKTICYGISLICTAISLSTLLAIGF